LSFYFFPAHRRKHREGTSDFFDLCIIWAAATCVRIGDDQRCWIPPSAFQSAHACLAQLRALQCINRERLSLILDYFDPLRCHFLSDHHLNGVPTERRDRRPLVSLDHDLPEASNVYGRVVIPSRAHERPCGSNVPVESGQPRQLDPSRRRTAHHPTGTAATGDRNDHCVLQILPLERGGDNCGEGRPPNAKPRRTRGSEERSSLFFISRGPLSRGGSLKRKNPPIC
jgi:hypothetical protein